MKKTITTISTLVLVLALVVGVTHAAFNDKATILGATFSVGSAELKLLLDIAGGVEPENLVDEMEGPTFDGVNPYWQEDYLVKIYNNSSSEILLTTYAYYETINDPQDLRGVIFVEPFEWDDLDSDGVVDGGELAETSLGKKTLIKWKTEGYDMGSLTAGSVKGVMLRFSTDSVPTSKQGASALIDFEFYSMGAE